jgi:hypothetical protein
MTNATAAQMDYIDSLLADARMCRSQLGSVVTIEDAGRAIDFLLDHVPLRAKTRQAIRNVSTTMRQPV